MMDRLLSTLLNVIIVSLISGIATASLIFGYWGLMELLNARLHGGAIHVLASAGFAFGAMALVRNRNDLVDR